MKYWWINHKTEYHVGWDHVLVMGGSPEFVRYLSQKIQDYYPGCTHLISDIEECDADDGRVPR